MSQGNTKLTGLYVGIVISQHPLKNSQYLTFYKKHRISHYKNNYIKKVLFQFKTGILRLKQMFQFTPIIEEETIKINLEVLKSTISCIVHYAP